jgi:hypothetical protein
MDFIENLSPTSSDNEYFFYYNYDNKPVNIKFNIILKLVIILYLYNKKIYSLKKKFNNFKK